MLWNKSRPRPMYACVMLLRLFLAILLISSHAATLLAAMPVALGPAGGMDDLCCPLCVPADTPQALVGCGCGCGEAENDDRLPDAPHEPTTTISRDIAIPAPSRDSAKFANATISAPAALLSVNEDVAGHTNTMRFLASVGHWLN